MGEAVKLSDQVEELMSPSSEIDDAIWLDHRRYALLELQTVPRYTGSLDAVRSLGGMLVFASDIAADGLALVKLVSDTSTDRIVEYTGIASRLEHAWLAAALRMKGL